MGILRESGAGGRPEERSSRSVRPRGRSSLRPDKQRRSRPAVWSRVKRSLPKKARQQRTANRNGEARQTSDNERGVCPAEGERKYPTERDHPRSRSRAAEENEADEVGTKPKGSGDSSLTASKVESVTGGEAGGEAVTGKEERPRKRHHGANKTDGRGNSKATKVAEEELIKCSCPASVLQEASSAFQVDQVSRSTRSSADSSNIRRKPTYDWQTIF